MARSVNGLRVLFSCPEMYVQRKGEMESEKDG